MAEHARAAAAAAALHVAAAGLSYSLMLVVMTLGNLSPPNITQHSDIYYKHR